MKKENKLTDERHAEIPACVGASGTLKTKSLRTRPSCLAKEKFGPFAA